MDLASVVAIVNAILATAGAISFTLGIRHFLYRGEWLNAAYCLLIGSSFTFIAIYAIMLLTPDPIQPLYARIAVWPIYAGLTVAVLHAIWDGQKIEQKIREYDNGDN